MSGSHLRIAFDRDGLAQLCRQWKVVELSLFGSALRDDFSPESDIDVLVSFAPDADWSLFDIIDMADRLKAIFGREVDLVEKEAVRNPFRRREILSTREVVFAV